MLLVEPFVRMVHHRCFERKREGTTIDVQIHGRRGQKIRKKILDDRTGHMYEVLFSLCPSLFTSYLVAVVRQTAFGSLIVGHDLASWNHNLNSSSGSLVGKLCSSKTCSSSL